ncbi:MAG: hypothetical protein WCY82_11025 [Desulfotomaculaceae bacterium]
MANNAYDLAKLLADVASGPKVYVVPDNQMQGQPAQQQQQMQTQQQAMPREQVRYGEEVPRQSWQQNAAAFADAIGSYRKANPVKIPLPAGTKTLAAKQFDEQKRQFDLAWPYKEASYQYDLNKPYSGSGTGGTDDGLPSTQGEREALATATLFDSATSRYGELENKGYEYPLYYSISTILSDPEWVGPAMVSGADAKQVIDNLIRSKGRMTPEEYFATKTGSKLKSLYDSLTNSKTKTSSQPTVLKIGEETINVPGGA